jgi:hypothetical protein
MVTMLAIPSYMGGIDGRLVVQTGPGKKHKTLSEK